MKTDSALPLDTLQDSLKSVHRLRRSTWASVLLMIIGVAIVIGSLAFSISRLRPLEHQVKVANSELDEIAHESIELRRANADAKVEIEKTKGEMESALATLREVSQKALIHADAKGALRDAIVKIRDATSTLNGAQMHLDRPNKKPGSEPKPGRQALIKDLFSDQPHARLKAYEGITEYYGSDPALIPELLSYAGDHMDNEDGIYNTLVVLSHLDKAQAKPHTAEIEIFAKRVEPMSPEIRERVDKVVRRLPQ